MNDRTEIRRRVQALKQGDVIHVDTNVDIQDREFHVERVEPAELHVRDGNKHYRVYVRGTGNQKGVGAYVINLDRPEWSGRVSDHIPPELFYIEDESLPAGRGEHTEGSITKIE
ncbi:hypothetical protein [Halorhabdus sp. CUG00001]|uniref:hypothetical protein n=1 Tax=Halorhabdus sp. CUG00001 TaxID=2600297 RepID=UPI00131C8550|nr:hypothetical protein [Halorhabdus sp. CUG00001]